MKMHITILVSLFMISISSAFCQNEIAGNLTSAQMPTYTEEIAPSFVGGQEALARYLHENIEYPALSKNMGVEGTVVLQYFIEPDGSIRDIMVVKGVSPDIDEEALRVVNSMPKWNPGIRQGEPVRVCYQLPIRFNMDF